MRRAYGRRAVDFRQSVSVNQAESKPFHAFDHRRRRRGAGDHCRNGMIDPRFHFVRRVDQRRVNDRRAAIVAHFFRAHQIENRFRLDFAQAHISPGLRRDRPGKTPAVAMKHWQRPQINRMTLHAPSQDIADGIHVGAAMVRNDAFRIARCAGGIVQRDGVPLITRISEAKTGIAFIQK